MHADPIQTLINKLHDLPPERSAEVAGFVDFLRSRTRTKDTSAAHHVPLDFPVDHAAQWPEGLSLYALNRGDEIS